MENSRPNDKAKNHLPIIRIGEVAHMTGLSATSLRNYEELGLVLPSREASGLRLYSLADVEWIKQLQAFSAKTKIGPTALSWVLRALPFWQLAKNRVCNFSNTKTSESQKICWQNNAKTPGCREACRACPAYQKKQFIFDFRTYFEIRVR